jgi:hypothetical protein
LPRSWSVAVATVALPLLASPSAAPGSVAPEVSPPATAQQDAAWPTPFSVDARTLPPASALRAGTLRVLVLGDSVGAKLGVALRYRQEGAGAFVAERGVGDCTLLNREHGCAVAWVSDVAELRPDVTFLVLGGGFFAGWIVHGKTEHACDLGWHDAYRARLVELLDAMGPSAGRVVLALVPYPVGTWRSGGLQGQVDCFNELLAEVAKVRGLSTVDIARHLCPTEECRMVSDGAPIRPDGLHPDGVGAEETARWTLAEIQRR